MPHTFAQPHLPAHLQAPDKLIGPSYKANCCLVDACSGNRVEEARQTGTGRGQAQGALPAAR